MSSLAGMFVRGGRVQRRMRDFDAHGHLLANSGEVIFSASHLVSWAQVTSSHIGCLLDGRGTEYKNCERWQTAL
jgi:hypothetical protein